MSARKIWKIICIVSMIPSASLSFDKDIQNANKQLSGCWRKKVDDNSMTAKPEHRICLSIKNTGNIYSYYNKEMSNYNVTWKFYKNTIKFIDDENQIETCNAVDEHLNTIILSNCSLTGVWGKICAVTNILGGDCK